MRFRTRNKPRLMPDVTPLVDVVFLLLIFFMITTTFFQAPGLKVDLPGSKHRDAEQEKKEITVTITAEGEYRFGAELVPFDDLENRLLNQSRRDPEYQVIIRADSQTPHRFVVRLMDAAKSVGLNRMAIATVPESSGGAGKTPNQ